MKIIHGSLKNLLQEVKDHKGEAVRVAALLQTTPVPEGIPRYEAWVTVSAPLDWDLWTEWRLLIGRGPAQLGEGGAVIPERITTALKEQAAEVRARVTAAGLRCKDGLLASDREAMDGVLD